MRAGTGNSERGQNYGVWKQTKKQTKTQDYFQNYSCQDSKKTKNSSPLSWRVVLHAELSRLDPQEKKQIAESFSELKTKKQIGLVANP